MKLDPRVRLLIIILITSLAVLAKDIAYLAIVFAAAALVDIIMKLDIIGAIKRLRHFLWLILFIAFVQSLTVKGGTTLISIKSVNLLTTKGIGFAIEFVLRMGIILFAGLIAASSDGREMTDGLLKMGLPYEFAFMSAITLRFLPVFSEEFRSRMNAMAMRGIDIKKMPIGKKIKIYGYLIAPAVSGCIIKSRELALAMSSRGFGAHKKRTMLRELKLTAKDWVVIVISVLLTAGYLAFMYIYGGLFSL